MDSKSKDGERRGEAKSGGDAARLDQAIQGADDLLIASLKQDESRRRRRRSRWTTFSIGGLIMVTIATAVILGLLATSAVDKARAEQFEREGMKLWNVHNYPAAVTQFEAVVELNPENANAWSMLGWTRMNSGMRKEAVDAFKKCVELQPNHAGALHGLGQIAYRQGKLDEAEGHLLRAAEHGASAAWPSLAGVYLLKERYEDAQKWAEKMVNESQGEPSTMQFGRHLLDAAKAHKVSPELRAQLQPEMQSPETEEGWALWNQGKAAEAIAKFRAALEKNPEDGSAHNGLGFALLNTGKPLEAREQFQIGLKRSPNHAGMLNGLGRSYMEAGDTDKAIEVWLGIEKILPPQQRVVGAHIYGLAIAYMKKENYAEAIKYLERITTAYPDNEQYKQILEQARAKVDKK